MHTLFLSLIGIFGGFWRRWFGGWLEGVKWLKIRAVQHATAVAILLPSLLIHFNAHLHNWLYSAGFAAYTVAVIQIYWALGHKPYLDSGRGVPNGYGSYWYDKYIWSFVQWLGKKLGRKFNKHGKMHDFCGMTVRYTWPTLLLIPVIIWAGMSFWVLSLGVIVASVYAFCAYLKDWGLTDRDTPYAEFLSGMISTMLWFS